MIICLIQAPDADHQLKLEYFEKYFREGNEFLEKNNTRPQFINNPDVADEIGLMKFINNFAFTENKKLTEYIIKNGLWKLDAIEFFYLDMLWSKLKNEKINIKNKLNKAIKYQNKTSNPLGIKK